MADEVNVDITGDLVDGSFDAGQSHIPNAGTGAALVSPPGTVPAHGAGTSVPEAAPPKQDGEKEPESIRDILSNAFKGTESPKQGDTNVRQPGQPPVPGAAQGQAPAGQPPSSGTVPAPQLTKGEDGKYRNADGTFASSEQIQAFEAAQAGTGQQAPSVNAPQGMTPLEQQQYQSLPEELRQFVGRTMEGLAHERSRYQEYGLIEQLIGPRRQAWANTGMSPAVAINQLLNLSDFAGRDPGQFVLWMADQHNIDLDALLDARDAAQANMTPEMRAMQQQVQQLQNQIAGFTGNQQQTQHSELLNSVQTFATEKDAQGNLARPYFADVAQMIPAIIPGIRAQQPNLAPQQLLQAAYDAACWSSPQVREKMQAEQLARQQAEQQAQAARAKAASVSVTGGPSGDVSAVPDNPNRSLREELVYQFAAHSN